MTIRQEQCNRLGKRYSAVVGWSLFLLAGCLYPAAGQSLIVRELTPASGLSQTDNAYIYKDSYGFVWISSIDGLNRFDGRQVRVYKPNPDDAHSISNANICSPFFEDRRGDLWFVTESGIDCYRRGAARFDHYQVQSAEGPERTDYAGFYLEADRYLWLTCNYKLYRFDTWHCDQLVTPLPLTAARCAVQTYPNGRVHRLIACYWDFGPGLEVLSYGEQGQLLQRDSFYTGTRPSFPALKIIQAVAESDTTVWLATEAGLIRFNCKNPLPAKPLRPRKNQAFPVRHICCVNDSLLWITNAKGAIQPFDIRKGRFLPPLVLRLNGELVLEEKRTQELYLDREGIIWISVDGRGVLYGSIKSPAFKSLSVQARTFGIEHIFEDRSGKIWCADRSGKCAVFSPAHRLLRTVLLPQYPRLFQDAFGTIWIACASGLCRYDERRPNHTECVLPGKEILFYGLAAPDARTLFVATSAGLMAVQTKGALCPHYYPDIQRLISTIFIDGQRRLWTGGADGRIIVYRIENNNRLSYVWEYQNAGVINDFYEVPAAGGEVRVSTSKGLLCIQPRSWKVDRLTEQNGLPNQYLYAATEDRRGNTWMSSNFGLIRCSPHRDTIKGYTTHQGLSSDEYQPGAVLRDRRGYLWFGSTRGIDVFHPDSVTDYGTPPKLAITGIRVHSKPWHDTTAIEFLRRIKLSRQENTLTFELAAMEYLDPNFNQFKIFLQGLDSTWVDIGRANSFTYMNMEPGQYQFRFKACNSEGIWSPASSPLSVLIPPPIYKTWWFRTLASLLVLLTVGFAIRGYYLYQLREQRHSMEKKQLQIETELALQRERNRIAAEMHDELGGGLSTIRSASARSQKAANPKEVLAIVDRVSQISIALIESMSTIIWAMDTQNDSLDNLLSYLRGLIRNFLNDNNLAADLQIPIEVPEVALSGQFRHHIVLTVKEALHNIVKHAKATEVMIQIKVDQQLTITITDNGRGFDPLNPAHLGKGLKNMKRRIAALKGSIEWPDAEPKGTVLLISVPLPIAG